MQKWRTNVATGRGHQIWVVTPVPIGLLRLICRELLGNRDRTSGTPANGSGQNRRFFIRSTHRLFEQSALECCLILEEKPDVAVRNRTCPDRGIDSLTDTIKVAYYHFN